MAQKNKHLEPIQLVLPHQKRRAIELYHKDSPFRQKVVPKADLYQRHKKHRNQSDE